MKENIILMLKVTVFAIVVIFLHSNMIYSKLAGEDLMYWVFNALNSAVLVSVGMKAFNRK